MRILSVALALCISLFVQGQQVAKKINTAKGQIGFYEFKPANYSAKHPLIIFLHGIGERGNGTTDLYKVLRAGVPKLIAKGHSMEFSYGGKKESFVVLSPQLNQIYGSWQPFYVSEMINYAVKNLNIDPNRIYLTGLSLGGGGVWKFASASESFARQLAAIAPVCGTSSMNNGANIAKALLPVWAFHAQDDSRVSVSSTLNAINNINKYNPAVKPIKTIWATGGHNIWDKVYDPAHPYGSPNVFEWMLSKRRSNISTNTNTNPDPVSPVINKKPIAVTGSNQVITSTKTVLNGSRSSDPDGRIVKYFWKKNSGPAGGRIHAVNSAATTVSYLVPGKYTFSLTVTDDKGAVSSSAVVVTVKGAAAKPKPAARKIPPVAVAGKDFRVRLPQGVVRLDALKSYDRDGKIVRYQWDHRAGPREFRISNPNIPRPTLTNLVPGTYRFRLTVWDNDNLKGVNDIVVTVTR